MICFHLLRRLMPAACCLFLLAACGGAGTAQPGAPAGETSTASAGTGVPAAGLDGTQWMLMEYGPATEPRTLPEGAQITAGFSGGRVEGAAACNGYGGRYTAERDRLTIGEIAQTMRACAREDLNVLDAAYMQALGSATGYMIDGDTLTIDYEGGVLRFARGEAAAP